MLRRHVVTPHSTISMLNPGPMGNSLLSTSYWSLASNAVGQWTLSIGVVRICPFSALCAIPPEAVWVITSRLDGSRAEVLPDSAALGWTFWSVRTQYLDIYCILFHKHAALRGVWRTGDRVENPQVKRGKKGTALNRGSYLGGPSAE